MPSQKPNELRSHGNSADTGSWLPGERISLLNPMAPGPVKGKHLWTGMYCGGRKIPLYYSEWVSWALSLSQNLRGGGGGENFC